MILYVITKVTFSTFVLSRITLKPYFTFPNGAVSFPTNPNYMNLLIIKAKSNLSNYNLGLILVSFFSPPPSIEKTYILSLTAPYQF